MVKMMILLYIKNDDTSIYIDSEAEKSPLPHRYLSYPFVVGHDCELVAKGFFLDEDPMACSYDFILMLQLEKTVVYNRCC